VELGHSRRVSGGDRSAIGNAVRECESLSITEAVMGNQTMKQAARLAASRAYATRLRDNAKRRMAYGPVRRLSSGCPEAHGSVGALESLTPCEATASPFDAQGSGALAWIVRACALCNGALIC
jgi:hypothetical protein